LAILYRRCLVQQSIKIMGNLTTQKIHLKNLQSKCCVRAIKLDLESIGVKILSLNTFFVEIQYDKNTISKKKIIEILALSGVSIINSREEKIIEEAKKAVYELIFEMNNVDSIVKKSEYIVEKTGYNYRFISKLFSDYESITLEKYIIQQKIKKIKQLIIEGEFSLSEIAYMMDYSSVQYLSTQFKKETGITVSQFKNSTF